MRWTRVAVGSSEAVRLVVHSRVEGLKAMRGGVALEAVKSNSSGSARVLVL